MYMCVCVCVCNIYLILKDDSCLYHQNYNELSTDSVGNLDKS